MKKLSEDIDANKKDLIEMKNMRFEMKNIMDRVTSEGNVKNFHH